MPLKNFVSPHCHIQSLDTGSTPESFADREIELGTGYITTTDHGSMGVCRKVYDLAKKKKLTPILGLEAYFRDDDCPILKAAGIESAKDYNKYYHFTMHFLDAEAYETGARLLSGAPRERHGSDGKPLFNWRDIEELGSKNITMTSGCLIGIAQRHLHPHGTLDDRRPELGEAYFKRFLELCKPGNFYTEVFPHRCTHYWESGVFILLEGNTEPIQYPKWKSLATDASEKIKAGYLAEDFPKKGNKHTTLLRVMNNRKWEELEPKKIISVELREGFIPNECTEWTPDGDLQHGANLYVRELAKKYNVPIIISDDSHFAKQDDKIVQDVRLGNWRFHNSYHRLSSDEAADYFFNHLRIGMPEIESWIGNGHEWASRFKGFEFKKRNTLPTSFYPENTLRHTTTLIQKHGRMNWKDPVYVDRLRAEIELLHYNGTLDLLPYFFVDEEVCYEYEKVEELTGPGRGSAAGLLLTYLMGITHVDPLRYGLSKDRFMTLDRIKSGKLPDIDQDLPHRTLLVGEDGKSGWLRSRFGDCFAQISVDTTLKIKSSIKDVARMIHLRDPEDAGSGYVPQDIEQLTNKMPTPPQGINDHDFTFGYEGSDGDWVKGAVDTVPALQEYMRKYPDEWDIVVKCLGIARQKGRHACAYVIANEPVRNFMPTAPISDIECTEYAAPSVEAAGGLKMDFLVINSLRDIGDCIKLVQERSGLKLTDKSQKIGGKRVPNFRIVPKKSELWDSAMLTYDIWDLPEDQAVFRSICEGDTETVFQFNTPGARGWLRQFDEEVGNGKKGLSSIEDLAAFTALDRPGPLDAYVGPQGAQHNMLVEYANRAKGQVKIGNLPILDSLLPETYGVIVYQEQLTKVFQEVGKTTGIEAQTFREHISKKKMDLVIKDKEIFMRGAVDTIGKEKAEELWLSLETFGRYGFNKSHAVCYVVISYACAWLKHHYPLEWWTAVLRNADRNEIDTKFWRHAGPLIDMPDIAKSGARFEIQSERIRAPLSLLHGVGPKAQEEIVRIGTAATIQEFCDKIYAFRVAGKKPMLDDAGKQKLDKKGNPRWSLQRSALTQGVIATMIVSGAMDSLFPPDTLVLDQLMQFEAAKASAEGKKRPKPVAKKYWNIDQVARYQMRKGILPAYSAPLLPMALEKKLPCIITHPNGKLHYYKGPSGEANLLNWRAYEQMIHFDLWDGPQEVALLVYVVGDVRKPYGPERDKERAILSLDLEGERLEFIHWPPFRKKKLPSYMEKNLAGSICVVVLNRYSAEKEFNVVHLEVLFPALGKEEPEEASPELEDK
jgi:DNA polymerase III alpha subunit